MTTNPQGPTVPLDVHLVIERDGERYKIQGGKLQEIGEQLRGKRPFSVFNSIVLPAVVALVTTLLTATYQYVSWLNSVRLENATNIVSQATDAYVAAADAIGKRRYATYLFVPTVRDVAASQPASVPETNSLAPQPVVALAPPRPASEGHSLHTLHHQIQKSRFEAYYSQLKTWNESYDKLLTAIDYDLDRPIFIQVGLRSEPLRVYLNKIAKIDCSRSVTDQLASLDLDARSLKLQFAVIQHCFSRLNRMIDRQRNEALRQSGLFDQTFVEKVHEELGHVYTMGNEFRCYALRRIDYYRRQKTRAIIGPSVVWRRLFRTQEEEANRHFERAALKCGAENRPA